MSLRAGIIRHQLQGHQRVVAPATEPITLAEVKSQLRIDQADNSENDLLDLYIQSARETIEAINGIALITQTWRLTLDRFPGGYSPWWDGVRDGAIGSLSTGNRQVAIELPRYPLQAVTSMTVDGAQITVGNIFITDNQQLPGRLVQKFGSTLPVITNATANAIEIVYTAGYGTTAGTVPADIRLALLQMVAGMYQHRGDECSMTDIYNTSGARAIMDRRRVVRL